MVRKYIAAVVGGLVLAAVGVLLVENRERGAILGGTIGASLGLAYGIVRNGR